MSDTIIRPEIISARREVLFAANTERTEGSSSVKIEKDSPLDKGDAVITIKAPEGEERKAAELLNEFLKLRDKEPADIKKKIIVVTGNAVLKQMLEEKELKMSGVTTLFEDNGVTAKRKLLSPQYILEIKKMYNTKATVLFHSMTEGALLSLQETDFEEASAKLMKYLKTGDSNRQTAPNNEDKEASRQTIDTVTGYYFTEAWDYFLHVPEQRDPAYAFLKNNYVGNERLYNKVSGLFENGKPAGAGKKVEAKLLVELLETAGGKDKAAVVEEAFYTILDGMYDNKEIRNFLLSKLGQKNLNELLAAYTGAEGNKVTQKHALFRAACLTGADKAEKLGRLLRFMEDTGRLKEEQTADLRTLIGTEASAAVSRAFSKGYASAYPEMAMLPGGTYKMGMAGQDDAPIHDITVSAFSLAKTEVTQGQFKKLMGYNPASYNDDDQKPVEKVSWFEAAEYCARLSLTKGTASAEQKKVIAGLLASVDEKRESEPYKEAMSKYIEYAVSKDGKGLYRLPTEAEWEYAARGGKQNEYGTDDGTLSKENAVYNRNSSEGTAVVSSKKPNPLGLYDMAGNVWEWCADTWDSNYYKNENRPKKDPVNLEKSSRRVLRGGSWGSIEISTRAGSRNNDEPQNRDFDYGFRPARTVK